MKRKSLFILILNIIFISSSSHASLFLKNNMEVLSPMHDNSSTINSAINLNLEIPFLATNYTGKTDFIESYTIIQPSNIILIGDTSSVYTCSAYFFDTGGKDEDFVSGENSIIQIYPSNPGSLVQVFFDEFDLGLFATLTIRDGNEETSPILAQGLNTDFYQQTYAATENNFSGCLTIEFTDNSSSGETAMGWEATIRCIDQPIIGCTDPNACNYDSTATQNSICDYFTITEQTYVLNGSVVSPSTPGSLPLFDDSGNAILVTNTYPEIPCQENLLGCTSDWADNYNELATYDDGSCELTACPYPDFVEYNTNYTIIDTELCLTIVIEGCTNELDLNYNPQANSDDGSCISSNGCTSDWADNYNPNASQDDGSCELTACPYPSFLEYNPNYTIEDPTLCLTSIIVLGCTNETAENYNPEANTDDGTCIINGCTLALFPNYNPQATQDDLSCTFDIVVGCMDSLAFNYNVDVEFDNGSCIPVVFGCTDQTAFNYDVFANTDNDSCVAILTGCTDATAFNYNALANQDDGSCIAIVLGCTDVNYLEYEVIANLDDGSCSSLIVEGCMDTLYLEYASLATSSNQELCITLIVLGCTDVNALNYNASANVEDGSCILVVNGCTSDWADNYNPNANQNDGSCELAACPYPAFLEYNPNYTIEDPTLCLTTITVLGCTNETAENYNPEANTNDGNCIINGCTLEIFPNYNPQATQDDLSCSFDIVVGCMDSLAFNYNPEVEFDNGSCIPVILGCTDSTAFNYSSICTYNEPEPTFLPDGSGSVYTTSIELECLAEGQTLTDVNDIISIDINIEHSFTGDLDMYITAPNGVQVQLFAQAGTTTWLGEATDSDNTQTNPGVGYDYGWSMNPTYNGTMEQAIANGNTTTVTSPIDTEIQGEALNPDIYLPLENFNALLGTPLNGEWTITVIDNYMTDNGWIFSWGIKLVEQANTDDGSCIAVLSGCTDTNAFNYNALANQDDGSCIAIVLGCTDVNYLEYEATANLNDGSCSSLILEGCMDPLYLEYASLATSSNPELCSTLIVYGCTDVNALNYNTSANVEDGSCILVVNGCTSDWADNYNPNANQDDGSCVYFEGNCNAGYSINLQEGWNLFGYTCENSTNDLTGLVESIVDQVIIIKNNAGNVYLPEFNFNGIGDLEGGFGYQMKITSPVTNFNICE